MSAAPASGARIIGTVVKVVGDGGFGFLGRACGDDVFITAREARRAGIFVLCEGQRVEFEIGTDQRGRPAAMAVRAL